MCAIWQLPGKQQRKMSLLTKIDSIPRGTFSKLVIYSKMLTVGQTCFSAAHTECILTTNISDIMSLILTRQVIKD